MQTFHNHRSEPFFSYLKTGQKTIEGRLKKGKYVKIGTGDIINVESMEDGEIVTVEVTEVRHYRTFKEMLENEEIRKILPNVQTPEEGASIYRQFYSKEDEKRYEIVAIEVKLLC